MKDTLSAIAEIDRLVSTLAAESTGEIDFDRVVTLLNRSKNGLEEREGLIGELNRIKGDYRARILGMLKANLACRENDEDRELAVLLTEDEAEMNAADLIAHYRRVSNRFRKNFPVTFGKHTISGNNKAGRHDWRDYKI